MVSAYTDRGTVIGRHASDAATIFDHSSIPATVRKRFSLNSLTDRERAAKTLDAAVNRAAPRTDAPASLPAVARARPVRPRMRLTPETATQLTREQETFLALAAAAVEARRTPAQAAAYAARVQAQAMAMRRESTGGGTPAKRAVGPGKGSSKPADRSRKTSKKRAAKRRGKRGRR